MNTRSLGFYSQTQKTFHQTNSKDLAAQVGESERVLIQNFQKAFWASAKLNVRVTVFTNGRHVQAVALADKLCFGFSQAVAYLNKSTRPAQTVWLWSQRSLEGSR